MLSEEIISAIENLERLQAYYQDEYEYYLAKAMEAKEHQERIEVLLRDLDNRENYRLASSEIREGLQDDRAFLPHSISLEKSTSERRKRRRKELNLLEGQSETANGTNGFGSEEVFLDDEPDESLVSKFDFGSPINSADSQSETDNSNQELDSVTRFLELSKTVMPAIEEIFDSEPNKTLHLSYLHKTLNSKLNLQLSVEAVKLYLNQAIEQGYCRLDSYDRSCYISNKNKSESSIDESDVTNPGFLARNVDSNGKVEPNRDKSPSSKSSANSSTQRRKLHNLPPSSKLKVTLLKTVKGFLAEQKPDVFTSQDLINYLYTEKQQSSWSKNQLTKVRQAIANVLGRNSYLGTEWERVKLGTYRALN